MWVMITSVVCADFEGRWLIEERMILYVVILCGVVYMWVCGVFCGVVCVIEES